MALPARTLAAKGIDKRRRQHCKTRAMLLARLLLRHDFQHHIVGGAHRFFADAREVVDALVHAIVDNSFGRRDTSSLACQQSAEQSSAHSRTNLQRTTGLCPITNHASEVGYHVFHRMTDVRIIATHEIGDATTAANAGHHTPTKGAELTETLLDIDGCEVAQDESSREFFLGVLVLFGINGHGIGGADALVARARIAHHGD